MSERPSKRLKSSSSKQEDEDNVRSITSTPERTAVDYDDASPNERLAHHQPRLPRGPPEQPLHIWREPDLQDDSTTSSSSPAAKDENFSPNSPQQPPLWQPPSHTVGQQGLHYLEDPFTGENQRNTQRQPSNGYHPNDVPRIAVGNHGTLPPRWIIEADTEPAQPREPPLSPVQMELFIHSQFDAWIHVDLPRHVYQVWEYQPSPPREIASPRLRWRFDPGTGHDDRWHDPRWRQYAWEVLRESLCDPLTRETLNRELIASTLFEHVRDISNPLPHLPPQPQPQPPPRPRTPERAAVRPEGAVSRWTTSEETDETEVDENEFDTNNHGKFTTDALEYEREPPPSMLYANARTAKPTSPGGRAFKAVMNMFGSGILSGPSRVTQQPVASHSQPIISNSSGSPAYRDEDERWKEIYRPPPCGLGGYFDPEEDHQRELEEQALAEERGQMEPVGGPVPVPNQHILRNAPVAGRGPERRKARTKRVKQDRPPNGNAVGRDQQVRKTKEGQEAQQSAPQPTSVKTTRASGSKGMAATLKALTYADISSECSPDEQARKEEEENKHPVKSSGTNTSTAKTAKPAPAPQQDIATARQRPTRTSKASSSKSAKTATAAAVQQDTTEQEPPAKRVRRNAPRAARFKK